jgi:IS30 family transposase
MGQDYRHFSLEERCEIARLQAEGRSIRQIAAALDRSPSSIARELKRNTVSGKNGYKPAQASDQARARRWKGSRLERQANLQQAVLKALGQGLSPEQVSGHAPMPLHIRNSTVRWRSLGVCRNCDGRSVREETGMMHKEIWRI